MLDDLDHSLSASRDGSFPARIRYAIAPVVVLLALVIPTAAEAGIDVRTVQIAPGGAHTCALLNNGSARCWGLNAGGQLGNGTFTSSTKPSKVVDINSATQVDANGGQTCFLLEEGTVKCAGVDLTTQESTKSNTPTPVANVSDAIQIATGESNSCALISTGQVKCWGINWNGQLGNGSPGPPSTAVAVTGLGNATQVAVGLMHSCALTETSQVKCWGGNGSGQLGDGTTNDSAVPVTVRFIDNAVALAAGWSHTCALLVTGSVKCWGANRAGQLGNGKTVASRAPVTVSGVTRAVQVTAGLAHTCAVSTTGVISCWGLNGNGQLGNGKKSTSATTTAVTARDPDLREAVEVATKQNHTCALDIGARITCWGANGSGQLGCFTFADWAWPQSPRCTLTPSAITVTRAADSVTYALDLFLVEGVPFRRYETSTSTNRPSSFAPPIAGNVRPFSNPIKLRNTAVRWFRLQQAAGGWSEWLAG